MTTETTQISAQQTSEQPQQPYLPPEQIKAIRAALLNQIKITQDNVLKLKMKLARLTDYCKHEDTRTEQSTSDNETYRICNICGMDLD